MDEPKTDLQQATDDLVSAMRFLKHWEGLLEACFEQERKLGVEIDRLVREKDTALGLTRTAHSRMLDIISKESPVTNVSNGYTR